jgi:hypothetical protein
VEYNSFSLITLFEIEGVKEWDRIGLYSDNELRGIGKVIKTDSGTFVCVIKTYIEFSNSDELTALKIFRFSEENCYAGYLVTLRINREILLSPSRTITWVSIKDPFAIVEKCTSCTTVTDVTEDTSHHECCIQ